MRVGLALGFGTWYHIVVVLLLLLVCGGVAHFRLRTNTETAARLSDLAGLFIFGFDALLALEILRLNGVLWP